MMDTISIRDRLVIAVGTTWNSCCFVVIWAAVMTPMMLLVQSSVGSHNAWGRLAYEVVPCVALLLATWIAVYVLSKCKSLWPRLSGGACLRELLLGSGIAVVWLVGSMVLMLLAGLLRLEVAQEVSLLPVWIIAAVINVIAQEYLVRGYLFTMIKQRHSAWIAIVVTTIVFVALHGFVGGFIGIMNVTLASLIFSLLLLYTGGLLAPIVAHIVWNVVGAICFGVVNLGGLYPELMRATLSSNQLIGGGDLRIEGSLITTIVSVSLIVVVWGIFWYRKHMGRNNSANLSGGEPS